MLCANVLVLYHLKSSSNQNTCVVIDSNINNNKQGKVAMTTNVELLHGKGVLNKAKLSADKISAINALSAEEVVHIEAARGKLNIKEISAVESIVGLPL